MPGYRVFEGARIRLSVNRQVGETEEDVFEGFSGVGLFRYRLENGFLKRHIRVRLNSYRVSTDLFNDFLKPGEEIWHLVPKRNDATILLYVDGELIKTVLF
jgi:serine/threonine-protein kinase